VRGVNNSDTGLVTCSRDKTIRLWTPVGAFPRAGRARARSSRPACALACPLLRRGSRRARPASGQVDRGRRASRPQSRALAWSPLLLAACLEKQTALFAALTSRIRTRILISRDLRCCRSMRGRMSRLRSSSDMSTLWRAPCSSRRALRTRRGPSLRAAMTAR
jgi:hypothetical protein